VSFSQDAWQSVRPWFDAMLRHPFLSALADGSLEEATFVRYLVDDSHYLERYARVLAQIAARAPDAAGIELFAASAIGAVAAERELHRSFLGPHELDAVPSPTCVAYTGYLQQLASGAPVEVAIAGALPCFRVYAEAGAVIRARRALGEHPYAAWIDTYASPEFQEAVDEVEAYADGLAGESDAMRAAYATATRFEWMFWDAAWRGEVWPLGPQ
jgi:thiaminase (transcriptional activator TenA)